MKYNHKQIETKWQKFWLENKTFKSEFPSNKPKYYILDMFPYTSGAGLHVGHVVGYTATDILARYHRQKGFNVLHPIGWDSFGLPAEQYAIRTGTHPAVTTKKNIDNFRQQLQRMGFSYDWDREFATTDTDYYKWTQWIFTILYQKGLAYEAELYVNYCPTLGTVLANEEVENGRSKEGGYPIIKKPLRQWVLKITAYADRLIEDLKLVEWPESIKKLQLNWIGRSEGATLFFPVKDHEESIQAFTTRPDTLFGVTYMVLAPEHPLIDKITTQEYRQKVERYREEVLKKSDLERTDLAKEKTGVFTGAYAINPVNDMAIPIWIADYVLSTYGTGAIMAVPAHDERDFEFANVYSLPIIPVYDPGLIDGSSDPETFRKEVLEGERCFPEGGTSINSQTEEISFDGLEMKEFKEEILDWLEKKGIGKKTVNYKLRDWLFSRQRYWGEPFPLLHFEDGTKRVLELDELPLCPPEMESFAPSEDGLSPLARKKEWLEITDSKTGKKALRETNTMPQWAGSCWYYLRFVDPRNQEKAWSEGAEKYWMPVDLYVGGVEHAVLHLLYARFWHKVLYDCGFVHTLEPFTVLRNQGLVVARSYQRKNGTYVPPENIEERDGNFFEKATGEQLQTQMDKMSKSKLNGVTPDDIIEEFGADALRLYEMFMGPLEKEKSWNTDAVSGCYRFLTRFFDLTHSDKIKDEESEEGFKLGYRLVHGVVEDLENLQFNTAIAKMMEFLNNFTKLPTYPKKVIKWAVQILMPFAPHMAEELWQSLGCRENLSTEPLPEVDRRYLEEDITTYVIQINGKVRAQLQLEKHKTEEELFQLAKGNSSVSKHVEGKEIMKMIFIPNKLLNIVIKS